MFWKLDLFLPWVWKGGRHLLSTPMKNAVFCLECYVMVKVQKSSNTKCKIQLSEAIRTEWWYCWNLQIEHGFPVYCRHCHVLSTTQYMLVGDQCDLHTMPTFHTVITACCTHWAGSWMNPISFMGIAVLWTHCQNMYVKCVNHVSDSRRVLQWCYMPLGGKDAGRLIFAFEFTSASL